ncbi:glycosyltransferase family 4 protein [Carboxylicivirga sediminis]|uniref:Glycosyltransferase family 4 protein n=1 Tax=Carboxylicivirga sediminis TaxID=2006564 RepID=A0A941F5T4_9BACT|nr:glycosyltransferase family 4 protein [Carboxylicivirga sediminis]MBR8537378.1 glycosyltransferase family 4 protein [Carboxylicivirga sediminis]
MKILFIHNKYKQAGGEDAVLLSEEKMLDHYGCTVRSIIFNNDEINSSTQKALGFFSAIYSFKSKKRLAQEIQKFRPDVIHVHNFFPLVSPSVYDLANSYEIPVVQTLHNYRLICPGALLLKDNTICEKCVKGNFTYAIINRCYRQSFLGSTSVALMDFIHRLRNTWNEKIDRIICLTEFARSKFVDAGFTHSKIVVKPNFVTEKKFSGFKRDNIGLFVGRISVEKGVDILVKINDRINGKLLIVGDGPEIEKLRGLDNYVLLGLKKNEEVQRLMQQVSFLVFPSIWYEGLPMTILEAFSNKLPVIATNIGAMSSVIDNHRTGLHFNIDDCEELIDQINWAYNNFDSMREYGMAAYNEYLKKYSLQVNYKKQIEIYQDVINEKKRQRD